MLVIAPKVRPEFAMFQSMSLASLELSSLAILIDKESHVGLTLRNIHNTPCSKHTT